MDGTVRRSHGGKIFALRQLTRGEHASALEADLLRAGLRMDDLNWRDLDVFQASTMPGSALYASVHGHHWTQTDALIADLIDAVQGNTYAVLVAGGAENLTPPEPFPRPEALMAPTSDTRPAGAIGAPGDADSVEAWLTRLNGADSERRGAGT